MVRLTINSEFCPNLVSVLFHGCTCRPRMASLVSFDVRKHRALFTSGLVEIGGIYSGSLLSYCLDNYLKHAVSHDFICHQAFVECRKFFSGVFVLRWWRCLCCFR